MTKYFLKIKGHTHNIFSLRIGQDKTEKPIRLRVTHIIFSVYELDKTKRKNKS